MCIQHNRYNNIITYLIIIIKHRVDVFECVAALHVYTRVFKIVVFGFGDLGGSSDRRNLLFENNNVNSLVMSEIRFFIAWPGSSVYVFKWGFK